ncbi:acyl-CoA dehydrogenase [Frankia sp. CNm7]|uniref:Acyl-[acyl-carrier-protein] dehydrogenase MbtN n=1 Tax=Frankia nepalensis TaxID=1836974 RepID=A0A937RIG9_9ACTN|nr:acyl-CoA dehydrogenase family protein [Frankia nepalensis]MBL7494877.1 acyl-CoA dehydrogenase [Frankia nepalensis]MBL7514417.1 acyl-CoA dehydrogenase [Frankia nepalensis]MBL7518361.1 acyl-CoA dehydrogenase [Frankia nepalensis]MBL7632871.1 acyl-CoA dehydrogenase [Frankia nepalensis]
MSVDASVESYRNLLKSVFDDEVRAWVAEAEATRRFPRPLLRRLGAAGVFAEKWGDGTTPDLARLNELSFALGRLGSAGVSVGVSLHDSAISIIRRFGRSALLRSVAEQAIRGEAVLCLAASESSGGSDLQIVQTAVCAEGDELRVKGRKKFVSLSPLADYILVVARSVNHDPSSRHGSVALVLVPTSQVTIMPPYATVSAGPLETSAVEIDTRVPADHLIARAGTGLAAVSWGLAHERLSVAGQVAATCDQVLGITLARMQERTQFGRTLFDHQALRLRVADLQARVDMLRHALTGIAAGGHLDLRTAAAMKVSAARLGEEVVGECMHIFGGSAFLTDETPLARWWRDMKLARVGGGTDEVLWELVAAAMRPDVEGYRAFSAAIS